MSGTTPSAALIGRARTEDEAKRLRRAFWFLGGFSFAYMVARYLENPAAFAKFAEFLAKDPGAQVGFGSAIVIAAVCRFAPPLRAYGHVGAALALIVGYHSLVAFTVPFEIRDIGASYLIFFYHFPSAFCSLLFCTFVGIFSIAYIVTRRELWSHCAFAFGQIGLVALTITLVSGSSWAKAAWGHWWVWEDARLTTAAVMWLIYAGYIAIHVQVDDPSKRALFAAVHGIAALPSIGLVRFAINLFGQTSHPMKFEDLSSNWSITATRWAGVIVFFVIYALIFRWRLSGTILARRSAEALSRVRRLEERGLAS